MHFKRKEHFLCNVQCALFVQNTLLAQSAPIFSEKCTFSSKWNFLEKCTFSANSSLTANITVSAKCIICAMCIFSTKCTFGGKCTFRWNFKSTIWYYFDSIQLCCLFLLDGISDHFWIYPVSEMELFGFLSNITFCLYWMDFRFFPYIFLDITG